MRLFFFILGLLGITYNSAYEQKSRARKAAAELSENIMGNKDVWDAYLSQLIKEKKFDHETGKIIGGEVFLIEKKDSSTYTHYLNNTRSEFVSKRKYRRIKKKLDSCVVCYSYALDHYSLYYRNGDDFPGYILWMSFRTGNTKKSPSLKQCLKIDGE